jgi:FkbM family methyltransferase
MLTFKQRIQNVVFPLGSIQKIRRGYLKGYKIRLTQNSLWSPLIGGWEPAMQKIMVNVVKDNSVVYDLGANNGLHGLLMARLVGSKGRVFNFEPLPENIEEIDENFKLNNIHNYTNVQAAVSDKKEMLEFQLHEHAKQGHIATHTDKNIPSIQVPAISLDDFIESGNPAPDFIKIDIEGAEGAALKGFSTHIRDSYPDMIIELHNPEQDRQIGEFLKANGYTAFRFDPFKKLQLIQVRDYTRQYPHPAGVWGTLFCVGPGKSILQYSFTQ